MNPNEKLDKLAEEYAMEPNSVDNFTTGDILLMKAAYKAGFLKRNEMCAYLADLYNPYPDLSFFKYKEGFELLKKCIEEMTDLTFSRYK